MADPRPSVISRPFEVRIGQSGSPSSVMRKVRLEVQGFALNSGQTAGELIGSVDYYTDEVVFPGSPITTAGNGTYRLAVDVPTGRASIAATVTPEHGLDDAGRAIARPGSTLLSFTIPPLPLEKKLQQIALRFNVADASGSRDLGETRTPSPAVGVTNPPDPGTYQVRAWVRTGDGAAEVTEFPVEIYAGPPVRVSARRVGSGPVRVGQPIRLRISASSSGAPTTVVIRSNHGLGSSLMGPGDKQLYMYYTQPDDRGRTLRLTVSADSGRPITFAVRVEG